MNYQEFNSWILDYYIAKSISSFCYLSIDKIDIEKITPLEHIKQFDQLKGNWNQLVDEIDGVPQYFGLLAIQCYAASQMHSDEYNAADAYQIRLKEVLGVDDDFNLQQLFRGDNPDLAAQENIWHSARHYLQEKWGLWIHIPPRTSYAGRYVQYPKSQVLLTLEDLKRFTQFFSEEFGLTEDVSFPYFKQRVIASLKNIPQTARGKMMLENEAKGESCLLQIFNYFNRWEGEIYSIAGRQGDFIKIKKTKQSITLRTLLIFEDNKPIFFAIDKDNEVVGDLEVNKIIQGDGVTFPFEGLILFNEMEYYQHEFVSARFLYSNNICYIIVHEKLRPAEFRFLERNSLEKSTLCRDVVLYKCNPNHLKESVLFSRYIQAKNPISLIGGIKLNRRREYLVGFGPSINCPINYIILHENARCVYDPENANEGVYKIRIDNYKDVEFKLVGVKALSSLVPTHRKGWNLGSFKIDEDFHIEGCSVLMSRECEIRTWIDFNLQKGRKSYQGKNVLLKAIKQASI